MPDDYGYGNARLRAMKSRLLTQAGYEGLLAQDNVEELLTALTMADYKEDIETALVQYSGVRCMVEALRLNMARTFQKVRSFFPEGEPHQLIRLLLSRWDLHNVKTIVRGQVARIGLAEMLQAVSPAGQLDMVALETMAQQPGLQATVDLMLTQRLPYAHALSVAVRTYHGRRDLPALELALDRYHYETVLASLQHESRSAALVRHMVETEIDVTNLGTLLRLRFVPSAGNGRNVSRDTWLLAGGRLSDQRWEVLSSADTGEALLHALEGTPYGRIVEVGLEGGVACVQQSLERYLVQEGIRMWREDPLSIAPAISYTWAKVAETTNIRLITYAVAGEIARPVVREELMVWPS